MLVELAIADTYGAGFEYSPPEDALDRRLLGRFG